MNEAVTFQFLPHKTIPGAGVVVASSGAILHRASARGLLEATGDLIRAGVPIRPWPAFLPSPEIVREERESLRVAVAALEEHLKVALAERNAA